MLTLLKGIWLFTTICGGNLRFEAKSRSDHSTSNSLFIKKGLLWDLEMLEKTKTIFSQKLISGGFDLRLLNVDC